MESSSIDSDQFDLSVIVPTRNAMPLLKGHVSALNEWIKSAQHVVVVDSDSTDGTVEYLKKHLEHHSRVFLNHPPGLYESWNRAVQMVESTYVYFATVGDRIQFDSLKELYRVALENSADVVLSPPTIISSSTSSRSRDWPIHRFADQIKSKHPYILEPIERFVWNVHALPGTLLGSSSSNIYRTSVLKADPFPCEYGHAGDSAWAVARPFSDRWVVAPGVESSFIKHSGSGRERWGSALSRPMLYQLAIDTWKSFSTSVSVNDLEDTISRDVFTLLDMYRKKGSLADEWARVTESAIPWFLSPRAFTNRQSRKDLDKRLRNLASDLCSRVTSSETGTRK